MQRVVAIVDAGLSNSMHVIFEPFRPLLTEPITNVDIKGSAPSSDTLEKMNTEEFIVSKP